MDLMILNVHKCMSGFPALESATRQRWEAEQVALKAQWTASSAWCGLSELRRVAGVDLSFVAAENETDKVADVEAVDYLQTACAALIVMEFPSMTVLYERYEWVSLDQPYIPGFLAFREVPVLARLLCDLRVQHPELIPDVVLVDGNGVLHPRAFGLACHLGVVTDLPTVGVAKKFFELDGLTKEAVKAATDAALQAGGDSWPIQGESGTVWAAAVRTTQESLNPVFVSVGHRMDLGDAISVVLSCSRHRVPEPIRQADLRSRAFVRDHNPPPRAKNASTSAPLVGADAP
jgi:deoxyinosine 3'endonuclease (endonuclease V)